MINRLLKKENGETEIIKINYELYNQRNSHSSITHLCTNCDNCYAAKCLKVFDEVKRPINEYEFISDGLQLFDNLGQMQCLYVTNCSDYKEDRIRKKPTTKEEIDNLRRIKESIKMAYYNAETIEEADQTQLDILRRERLKRMQSEEKVKKLK